MFEITVKAYFAAAHHLKDYGGKCENIHGHNWNVEATLAGKDLNQIGMVEDFKKLRASLNDVLDELDHQCLNDLSAFKDKNPTTENVAKYIYEQYQLKVAPVSVKKIRVWESERAGVTYFE